MANETEAATPGRDVDPHEWGKAMLEEILFRAARDISAQGPVDGGATVSLTFRVAPDQASRSIEISTPGAVEADITTRVPL